MFNYLVHFGPNKNGYFIFFSVHSRHVAAREWGDRR